MFIPNTFAAFKNKGSFAFFYCTFHLLFRDADIKTFRETTSEIARAHYAEDQLNIATAIQISEIAFYNFKQTRRVVNKIEKSFEENKGTFRRFYRH